MITELIASLIIIPSSVLCLLPMHEQLKYSTGRTVLTLILASLVLIPSSAWMTWHFSLGANNLFLPLIPIYYLIYHRLLNVPVCKSLAIFCATFAWISILSNFANGYDATQNPHSGADIISAEFLIFQFLAVILSIIIFFYPLWKYGAWIIRQLDLKQVWYATIPVTAVFFVNNLGLRPIQYETLYMNRVFFTYWLSLTMMLLLFVFLGIVFYFTVSGILRAAQNRERMQFLEMKESQFRAQQNYMEATSRVRHDFRQNIRALLELYRAGDYQTMGEYLQKYEESLPQNEVIFFCRNHSFNALLNYYANLAEQCRISLHLDIDLPEHTRISDVDLCSMTGNILENSFYAAQTMENGEGWIYLSVKREKDDSLYIVGTNSFDGQVRQKNGRYLSTRRKGDGIGLASVITTAERYGGRAYFYHEGDEFCSNVQIPLNTV